MRISGLELIEVRLRLRERFVSSLGAQGDRRVLLLRIEGFEGHEGWGECVAGEDPSYSYETTETAWYVLTQFLLPALIGHEVEVPEDIWTRGPVVRGHPMAKAAVEAAVWDLQAREIGVPLWELLGGARSRLAVGVSVGLQADDEVLAEKVEAYLSQGYARVKLKIEPGRDFAMVRSVRERLPDAPLSVDANGSYTLDQAARIKELDALGLLMIEQPLGANELVDHVRLREMLGTPICLDESVRSQGDALAALELGACDVISIKTGPCGGLAQARAILDLCLEREVPTWCGGMLESGVGRAHNLAFATLPGLSLPGDISESQRYWERDIVSPEFILDGGGMLPPTEPGIGVQPDRSQIRQLMVRRCAFGAVRDPVAEGAT
jgi:O-succinylbenzoate synthase